MTSNTATFDGNIHVGSIEVPAAWLRGKYIRLCVECKSCIDLAEAAYIHVIDVCSSEVVLADMISGLNLAAVKTFSDPLSCDEATRGILLKLNETDDVSYSVYLSMADLLSDKHAHVVGLCRAR